MGGAGGNIGEDHGAAATGQAFGQGRHHQGAPGRRLQAIPKVGPPGRYGEQAVAFVQGDAIAFQAVAAGQTARGDGRRRDPGRRREDAAMIGEDVRPIGEANQVGRKFLRHHVGAEAIANDEDGPFHRFGPTPLSRVSINVPPRP